MSNAFTDLGCAEPLRRALDGLGYHTPTPIQTQAIPPLLAGADLLGIAQTGTGKTAAFALPLLQRLGALNRRGNGRPPAALILAPTRELALQIGEAVSDYGRHLPVRSAVIFGGVGQNPQVRALQAGLDILIATPGRLLDLMQQGHVRLDHISILVLDEADRMLDMGFVRDVRRIVAALPKARQSMLFSATMPPDIAALAAEMLHRPQRVEVAPSGSAVAVIDQQVFFVGTTEKRALLTRLLQDAGLSRVIVFTRTKHGANRVVQHLAAAGLNAEAIHGNKSQSARQQALSGFRSGRVRVLVATDIAARGIDVDDVSHIINFDLPNVAETYVHRIGRTARAGADGTAYSFCDASERAYLSDIEKLIRKRIPVSATPPGLATAARTAAPTAAEGRAPSRRGSPAQGSSVKGKGAAVKSAAAAAAAPSGATTAKAGPSGGPSPERPGAANGAGRAAGNRNRRRYRPAA